ncbi:hypothetical protein PR003_g5824 [Phytophthora rubi]|uniref:Uncharacterized protein n=1 Tax=Phytophthora rubi TaxID=129364 RepID=A0A6A4FYN7_9STRA|nr:hypothetical protein PR003_g5824 [Phytophthora rubi]
MLFQVKLNLWVGVSYRDPSDFGSALTTSMGSTQEHVHEKSVAAKEVSTPTSTKSRLMDAEAVDVAPGCGPSSNSKTMSESSDSV